MTNRPSAAVANRKSTILDVRMERCDYVVGRLSSNEFGATEFQYSDEHVDARGQPISLSLPVSPFPFEDPETRAFFANLLHENDQMQQTIDQHRLGRNDVVGLLYYLGADCSGAVSCLPTGAPPTKRPGILDGDYSPIAQEHLNEIIESLAKHERLPSDIKDPSPLAGVQSKIALTLTSAGYALPKPGSGVPTTHILKVPRIDDKREAALEAAACRLARACGLSVSVPELKNFGGIDALLIERFDRKVESGRVFRIHQEDFTQVLSLPAALKYERRGTERHRFDAEAIATVLKATAVPATSRIAFLRATLFNLIVGNVDNHAKNHALLYPNTQKPILAPLYDIVPVLMFPQYTEEFAFRLGTAARSSEVKEDDLVSFAVSLGFSPAGASRQIKATVEKLVKAIETESDSYIKAGLKAFDSLIGEQMSHLIEILNLDLKIRQRDYSAPKGGGWAMS